MISRRLALVGPSVGSILRLRGAYLADVKKLSPRLLCVAPEAATPKQAADEVSLLTALGAEYRAVSYDMPGLKFLREFRVISALRDIFRDWQPDTVLSYGPDAMVYAALAAKRARVPRIVSLCNDLPAFLIPATGNGETAPTRKAYRRALAVSHRIVFHNADHPRILASHDLLPPSANTVVVAGKGVNIKKQSMLALPDLSKGLVFLMVARGDPVKGVIDFIHAARRVARHAKAAKFILAGPAGRQALDFKTFGFDGPAFEVIDGAFDLRRLLRRTHVFVYPSHSEGMPPSVLEALAAGRPVITTDTPGCRETVDATVNGYLVPRGDVEALSSAMDAILKRPDLIASMARASRTKAERRFDQRDVHALLNSALDLYSGAVKKH